MAKLSITLIVLAALFGSAPARAATVAGVGDQSPNMFSDSKFKRLGVKHARLIVPYDALSHADDRAQVDTWMGTARAARVAPLVSFEHSRKFPRKLPSVAEYRAAFKAFRARYPFVRTYSPFNEANHQSQPTFHKPRAAAAFYNVVRANCRGCKIVALDVLDQGGMVRYVKNFRKRAKKPRIWGLHNYRDTNRFRTSGTRALLRATKGQVWLTETGGIVAFAKSFRYSTRRAARALNQMFKLSRSSRRIKRLYIYNWNGSPRGARFDAGLVGPNRKARPGYRVVKRNVRRGRVKRGRKLRLRR